MYQLSDSPDLFLMVKAKTAPPFLMASFLSASLDSAEAMASKAADEGMLSASACQRDVVRGMERAAFMPRAGQVEECGRQRESAG